MTETRLLLRRRTPQQQAQRYLPHGTCSSFSGSTCTHSCQENEKSITTRFRNKLHFSNWKKNPIITQVPQPGEERLVGPRPGAMPEERPLAPALPAADLTHCRDPAGAASLSPSGLPDTAAGPSSHCPGRGPADRHRDHFPALLSIVPLRLQLPSGNARRHTAPPAGSAPRCTLGVVVRPRSRLLRG